jgi:predicted Zn-dependent protease
MKLNQSTALLAAGGLLLCTGLLITGCGGAGGELIQSMTGAIPGMGDSRTQRILDTGAKAVDRMDLESPQRQDELGQSVAVAITNKYPLSTDEALNDYVNLVGLTVASVAPNANINYAFGVIETPEVAAYSAPGGYIFISRGALALAQDESELAGVLAHEVAHVALNHGMEALKASKNAQLAVSAAKINSDDAVRYGQFIDEAVDIFAVKPHSRAQESDADTQAVKYLKAAGYDPKGLLRFLQKMQAQSGSGGGLMSTHPGTPDRIAAVQRQAGNATGATLKDRYAANVK